MSDAQKRELWDRWKAGESISQIARALHKPPGSVFTVVKSNGGYVPPLRRKRPGTLSFAEREEISRGLARGESMRSIARALGRPASTISREIARTKGVARYRAVDAEDRSWARARRPKPCLLAQRPALQWLVAEKLGQDCSPEQIAGYLAKTYQPGSGMRVSHETIYKSLFIQARGVLAKELTKHLRSGRPTRRNIHNTVTGQWRSQIIDAVSISQRPAEAEDRAIPGHWEGDLLLGQGVTQIATLVERTTRFTVLIQLDGRDMHTVTKGLVATMTRLPEQVRRSLTWDRGMELAGHKDLTAATGLQVYFADPRSPWQRGTNENTNRLLRQYFPKGTSMADLTQDDLDRIAYKLNTRPRKTLEFDTPADRLAPLLR
ncbi:IS30 family transposase [Streptosporangium lutulentum]|uniref:IS30 family transposase n=2 Tax=Streptosporangium lutulentum TaxID=1461250 RepID=A0ABT9Q9M4_9ACTN|nr:IS30 family transposase [Streptosporangium lutulentum]MDP9843447.1 IS30 family transposase [Streptosporangium lutulentum]